jgi:hypothetical protein
MRKKFQGQCLKMSGGRHQWAGLLYRVSAICESGPLVPSAGLSSPAGNIVESGITGTCDPADTPEIPLCRHALLKK